MQIESLAIRLRLCAPSEAADLGVRLCQDARGSIWRCYLPLLLSVAMLGALSILLSPWLPFLIVWLAKPWLDRSILFALARAAFNVPTRWGDLWAARGSVWRGQFWRTWVRQRLSLSRSLTLPVMQLEQLRGAGLRARLRQVRSGRLGVARLMTLVFLVAQISISAGVITLWFWFGPQDLSVAQMLARWGSAPMAARELLLGYLPYVLGMALVEPGYVAAGFGLYLNRRVELEAWDIEQELRNALRA